MSSLAGVAELFGPKLPSLKSEIRKSGRRSSCSFSSALQWNLKWSLMSSSRRQLLKCSSSVRSNHTFRRSDEFQPEPFWLSLIREFCWGLQSLSQFLVAQPGQLRYIEWPSFGSTLKTASLTLALVAVLIVALSSIDSGLCYLLTLLIRRKF